MKQVASPIVMPQNCAQVNLANPVNTQPLIMAPKPIYPADMQSGGQNGLAKDTRGESNLDLVAERSERTRSDRRSLDEQMTTRENGVGLLKDAMLPRFERHGDDCDLVGSMYSGLDVTDLDAYLAGVNGEFGEYLEQQCFSEDSDRTPKTFSRGNTTGKRKQTIRKSQNTSKKKLRA